MADLEDVLAGSFGAGEVPSTGPALVRYAGSRRAVVQAITGLPRAPRRGEYATEADFVAERRRWNTAMRRVQRWDEGGKPGKQRRGVTKLVPLPPPVKRVLRRDATARKRDEIIRHGMRARMLATVVVGTPPKQDTRTRWMPAPPGPGVYLDGDTVRDILDAGDRADRAADFHAAFFEAYGLEDAEIEAVLTLKLWPDGEREPA